MKTTMLGSLGLVAVLLIGCSNHTDSDGSTTEADVSCIPICDVTTGNLVNQCTKEIVTECTDGYGCDPAFNGSWGDLKPYCITADIYRCRLNYAGYDQDSLPALYDCRGAVVQTCGGDFTWDANGSAQCPVCEVVCGSDDHYYDCYGRKSAFYCGAE